MAMFVHEQYAPTTRTLQALATGINVRALIFVFVLGCHASFLTMLIQLSPSWQNPLQLHTGQAGGLCRRGCVPRQVGLQYEGQQLGMVGNAAW